MRADAPTARTAIVAVCSDLSPPPSLEASKVENGAVFQLALTAFEAVRRTRAKANAGI